VVDCLPPGSKDGRFFCVYYDMGKQVWEPFGRGKEAKQQAEARDLEVKLRKKKGTWYKKRSHSRLTFHELAQMYLDAKHTELSANTIDGVIRALTAYALPVIGRKYISQVSMEDWWHIQERMTDRRVSNKTINTYFVYISRIFTWAVEENEGLIFEHPWQKRKRLKLKKRFQIDLFTHNEFMEILRHAASHIKWALEVAYYTGVRPGPSELFALKWTDVDWFNSRLKIYSPKTDTVRWVSLAEEFITSLKGQYKAIQKTYPSCRWIVHYNGTQVKSIKTGWKKAKEKAGIARKIRLYDIRHFYISYALANGADIMALAQSVGHVNGEMIMRVYAHLAKDLQKNAPHKIPSLYL